MIEGPLPSYAVITPVRDEAEHFPRTAASLVAQTHRPWQWVVVDDGSTDGTRAIAESVAAEHDWISVVSSGQAHDRARGAPIVRAFEVGRSQLKARPDITVKLDGDLFLPAHYFEWVAATFARSPRAGIVGGVAYIPDGPGRPGPNGGPSGRWRPDGAATHHVNGVAKAYSTECLDDIGGLRPSMGWDGIDEYSAKARGWEVHVLTELPILHYRLRGSKQPFWRSRWEEGRGNHYMGYTPAFLAVRAVYRMAVERPPVVGGLVLAAGFLSARLTGAARVDDPAAVAVLQDEQRQRLRRLLRRGPAVDLPPLPRGGPAYWA